MRIEKLYYTDFVNYVEECVRTTNLENEKKSLEELKKEKDEIDRSFNKLLETVNQRRAAMKMIPDKELHRQFAMRVAEAETLAEWLPADMVAEMENDLHGVIRLEMPVLIMDEEWPEETKCALLSMITKADEVFFIPQDKLLKIKLTYDLHKVVKQKGAQ